MTMTATESRLETLLPLMACPACRGAVRLDDAAVVCLNCAAEYALHEGRPVFLKMDGPPKVMSAEHVSNQPPAEVLDWVTWLDGWVLNVGAGGTLTKLENCVELEYSIFRNTDVVADAHALPFADAAFDAVVTFNTFEHLSDPDRAAAEIYRVLKPGGRLVLHTAFLQPVHEAPHHYYNTTEYGLRRWFQSFSDVKVSVSPNFVPAYVLAWLSSEMLRAVEAAQGPEARQQLATSTLDFWRTGWEDGSKRDNPLWDILRRLPQETQKRFAAGFQLRAAKPAE